MGEFFLVEYGKVYELCNAKGFVYCIVNKESGSACTICSLLIDEYSPKQMSREEYKKEAAPPQKEVSDEAG